jgi:hypothetical protein
MPVKKFVGALALGATLAAGGIAGALLGVPGVSGAETALSIADVPAGADAPAAADHGGPGKRFGRIDLGVAAEALGMTEDELRTALEEDGTSIADVAADKGVEVQKVVDAIVADVNARIDQAVTDGDLEADRAEELKSGLADRVTEMVNGEFRGGRGGPGHGHGRGHGRGIGGADLGVAAEALGMTEDELRTALEEDGTSIADVAADQDVDVQKVIDALVASATENLEERITDMVNGD